MPTGRVCGWGSGAAHLCHHASEGPEAEHAQGDAHQVLRGERRQLSPCPHLKGQGMPSVH